MLPMRHKSEDIYMGVLSFAFFGIALAVWLSAAAAVIGAFQPLKTPEAMETPSGLAKHRDQGFVSKEQPQAPPPAPAEDSPSIKNIRLLSTLANQASERAGVINDGLGQIGFTSGEKRNP